MKSEKGLLCRGLVAAILLTEHMSRQVNSASHNSLILLCRTHISCTWHTRVSCNAHQVIPLPYWTALLSVYRLFSLAVLNPSFLYFSPRAIHYILCGNIKTEISKLQRQTQHVWQPHYNIEGDALQLHERKGHRYDARVQNLNKSFSV